MKAVSFSAYGGPEVLTYADVEVPSVGPNDVLIRVKASSANFNDIWARRGTPVKQPLPHISGSDAAGVVEAIGSAVSGIRVGAEVLVHPGQSCGACAACARGESFFCRQFKIWGFDTGPCDGGHAEYARVHASQVVAKPSNISFEEAASMPLVLVTAWRMLKDRARVLPGDFVLIWGGAGGLGAMAIQIVRLFGGQPIAVVSSDEKARFVTDLGATHVINRKRSDVLDGVKAITRQGVDIVFEHSGQDTWPISVQALRRGGTLVVCGATSGYEGMTDIRFLWNKQQNFHGSHLGTRAELEEALAHVASGGIRPAIYRTLALDEVSAGQRMMEQGDIIGKIVYVPKH